MGKSNWRSPHAAQSGQFRMRAPPSTTPPSGEHSIGQIKERRRS